MLDAHAGPMAAFPVPRPRGPGGFFAAVGSRASVLECVRRCTPLRRFWMAP
jgi:hypothetical protein